jgi:hypothetical protein
MDRKNRALGGETPTLSPSRRRTPAAELCLESSTSFRDQTFLFMKRSLATARASLPARARLRAQGEPDPCGRREPRVGTPSGGASEWQGALRHARTARPRGPFAVPARARYILPARECPSHQLPAAGVRDRGRPNVSRNASSSTGRRVSFFGNPFAG